MEQDGLLAPSVINDLTINFRTTENDEKTLNLLRSFHIQPQCENEKRIVIKHKIFSENGAPFIYLCTNLSNRPLKLLCDTGAAISILASDIVLDRIKRVDCVINLYGIAGKDVSVKTQGMVVGLFRMSKQLIATTLHLVDRKYSGPADGYLGFSFFQNYNIIIDMNEMCVKFNLDNLVVTKSNKDKTAERVIDSKNFTRKVELDESDISDIQTYKVTEYTDTRRNSDEKIENGENFLEVLSENYEFPVEYSPIARSRNKRFNYREAVNYYTALAAINENPEINLTHPPGGKREVVSSNMKGASFIAGNHVSSVSADTHCTLTSGNPDSDTSLNNSECTDPFTSIVETKTLDPIQRSYNPIGGILDNYSYFPNYDIALGTNGSRVSEKIRSERIFQELKLNKCSEEEKITIKKICDEFPFQFYIEGDALGSTDVIRHKINLIPNNKIVYIRQYRIPETHRKIMNDIIEEHERQGIIERCNSIYNSPAILVKKKDEAGGMSDYRFVVDYRKLNENTE